MATFACPDCGNQMGDTSVACPRCGALNPYRVEAAIVSAEAQRTANHYAFHKGMNRQIPRASAAVLGIGFLLTVITQNDAGAIAGSVMFIVGMVWWVLHSLAHPEIRTRR